MDKPCFKTKIFLLCFRFAFVQMMYITFKILLLVYWQKLYFLKSFLMTFRKTLSSSSICNTQTFVIIFYHPHVRLESQSFFPFFQANHEYGERNRFPIFSSKHECQMAKSQTNTSKLGADFFVCILATQRGFWMILGGAWCGDFYCHHIIICFPVYIVYSGVTQLSDFYRPQPSPSIQSIGISPARYSRQTQREALTI